MQHSTNMAFFINDNWAILSALERKIKEKIEAAGTRLSDWNIKINRGILTGLNEAFIIDGSKRNELIEQDPKSAEIIRPILRGKDIKRYSCNFAEKYLIATFPSKGYDINDYPAIERYLEEFGRPRLEQSGAKVVDAKGSNARKKTNNKWFETQDAINYWDDFNRQKIMFQEMVQSPSFILDEEGYMCLDTARIITGQDLDLLIAVLNSSLFFYAIKNFYGGGALGNNGIRMKHTFFNQFPCIHFGQEEALQVRELVQEAMTNTSSRGECISAIDSLIYDAYGLNQEERGLIGSQQNQSHPV